MSLYKPPITEPAKSNVPPHYTLTSLSLTHVQFNQDDIISKLLAYITLSPLAILCGYVSVTLTRRELTPAVMLIGQLLNECINFVLKRIVKQARPTEVLGDGYGMPSSHSQFMAYFATYIILLMYKRGAPAGAVIPHVVSVVVVIWAALVIYSRVHLYYHTWQQVVAGTICGVVIGAAWFSFVNHFLRPRGYLDAILDTPVCQWAYIRDTEYMPDAYRREWELWREWRKMNSGKSD
ncbi:hypothetical protein BGZ73_002408 [Actinomortierella ambigua]|nr:hypothetical protein BGZ73_002408 [Actinomortierella ambigua]